jgi:hypothetical protein
MKKPTKRTQSNKKRIENVLNPKHPLYGKPKKEIKVPISELYKTVKQELRAVKWATAADRYSEALEKQLETKDRIRNIEKQLVGRRKNDKTKYIRGGSIITPNTIVWSGSLRKGRPRGRDETAGEIREDKIRKWAKQVRKEFKDLSRKEFYHEVGKPFGLEWTTIKRHFRKILNE